MIRDHEGQDQLPNRRIFLGGCLGCGVGVPLSATTPAGASDPPHPPSLDAGLLRWRVDRMEVLGIPEDWEAIRLGLHPFSPERVLVLPSGMRLRNENRCKGNFRDRIIERIERGRSEMACGPAPLPREKREVIFRVINRLTGYYDRPDLFEEWAVELADRESLSPTGLNRHVGLAHQFQHRGEVSVDCLPLDWWLILIPGGIDWASPDGEPVHALIAHVGQLPWYEMVGGVVDRASELACLIAREVDDWRAVGDMGPTAACRHLNPIVARMLEAMDF